MLTGNALCICAEGLVVTNKSLTESVSPVCHVQAFTGFINVQKV